MQTTQTAIPFWAEPDNSQDQLARQTRRVLEYMREFGSITQLEAVRDLGCMRLSARIYDLHEAGIATTCEWDTSINRWGEPVQFKRYRLGGVE